MLLVPQGLVLPAPELSGSLLECLLVSILELEVLENGRFRNLGICEMGVNCQLCQEVDGKSQKKVSD